ncbi:MAG TPA: hypothetical protein VH835_08215 [Dongiaceae bacterium]|jgi:hypothetical protein
MHNDKLDPATAEQKLAAWRAANNVPEKPGLLRYSFGVTARTVILIASCLALAAILVAMPFLLGYAPWLKPFIILAAVLSLFVALWSLRS